MGKHLGFLKECDLFYNLMESQLEMVENICKEHTYKAGEVIFDDNSHETELYLILRGQVDIIVNPGLVSPDSNTSLPVQTIATLRRGQSFGEIALVDEGIRSAGARAVSANTQLLSIDRKKFLMICDTYPELGYQIMFNLAADLAQKLRNTDMIIRESLLYGNTKTKRE